MAGTDLAPPERPWRIGEVDYAAPPLVVFRPPANGTFATASFTLRARLGPPTPAARVLARFEDGAPWLIEQQVGRGRVVFAASTADLEGNDLATRPVYVPLVQRLVLWLADSLEEASDVERTAGEALEFTGGAELVGTRVGIETPGGLRREVEFRAASTGSLAVAGETGEIGFYRWSRPGRSGFAAVNVPAAESDLTPLVADEIEERLRPVRAELVEVSPSGAAADPARLGVRSLTRPLLLALLATLVLESVIAGPRISWKELVRRRRTPSATEVDPRSGQVVRQLRVERAQSREPRPYVTVRRAVGGFPPAAALEFAADEQALCSRVNAAALRRTQPGDPDDAVPVADQGHPGALVCRNFCLDEEFLEFFLRGEPERAEAIPGTAAANRQRRIQTVQIECHARRIGAKRARVEPRASGADARRHDVSAGKDDATGHHQRDRAPGGHPRRGRRACENQPGAVAAAADASRNVPGSGAAAGVQERFDVAAREISGPARNGAQRQQQRAREHGGVCRREQLVGERVPLRSGRRGLEKARRVRLDEVGVAPQHLRQGAESLDDARVVLLRENRQQVQAQPVSQVAPRAVGGVGAPAHPARGEPALDRGPAREEQRVHQAPLVARGRDAAETRGSGSRQKAHQHGLGLVVPGVPERHDRPSPPRQAEQESEPHLAGEFLHRGRAAHPRGEGGPETEVETQAEAPRHRFDGGGVALRPGARAAGG